MPTVLQFRRGTTAQNNSFTGSAGELSIDTDLDVIRVHDGSQPGGYPLIGANSTQTLLNKTLSNVVISGTITANSGTGSTGQYLESTGTGVRWSTIDATQIASGTSTVVVVSSGGNVRVNVGGVTNTTFTSTEANVSANLAVTGQVGLGSAPTSAAVTIGGNETATSWTTSGIGLRINAATYTDSGTPAAGTAATNHINAIGQATLAATNGSVTTTNAATLYIAGAPVAGTNMTITNRWGLYVAGGNSGFGGDLLNIQANGVGNIGSSTTYFNTAFVKATSAQYADVAERYQADADYPVGTVLVIGGDQEVTQSTDVGQTSIAGTVSENPGVLMNRGLEGINVVNVALLGRVPCRVKGTIKKGDLLMSSDQPGVATKVIGYQPGCIVGKALEAYDSNDVGMIEIMVGRL